MARAANRTLPPAELRALRLRTADPIGSKGPSIDYGALAAFLGDSIAQQNSQGNPVSGDTTRGAVNIRGVGEMAQVMSLDPRVTFVDWYDPNKTIGSAGGASRYTDGSNQGGNSQNSTEIRARVGDLIARNIRVAIVNMGTNNTVQYATVIADIQATVQALRGAASPIAVILGTIRPNTVENEANSTRKKADIQAINAWIRTYVASLNDPGVVLWDAYAQYDRGDGYIDPLDTYDRLVHPSERGAELGAWGNDPVTPSPNSLTAAIRKLVKPGNTYADIIAANANLLANPTFTGSVTSNNSPITGVAPTGWQWSPQGTPASTIVASLEANAETGGQTAVATITPVGTSDFERINFRLSSFTQAIANLPNKWVRAFFDVETDGAAYLMTPVGILLAMDSTNTAKEIANALQVAGQAPPGSYRGPMRPVAHRRLIMTDPILCKSDATGLQPYLQVGFMPSLSNGVVSKVKVRRAWLGIVPDPRVAFGQAT